MIVCKNTLGHYFISFQASLHSTQSCSSNQGQSYLANSLLDCNSFCHSSSNDRLARWDRIWLSNDPYKHSCLLYFHRMEEEAKSLPNRHGWVEKIFLQYLQWNFITKTKFFTRAKISKNFPGAFNLLLQKLMMVVRPKSQQV